MPLSTHLFELEAAGLVTLAATDPEIEYAFRHSMIQEAVYDSLLKSERRELNRLAGEVLEEIYADRTEELAVPLAEHFWRAGDKERALKYFRTAAENARRSFANREAIDLYTRALAASSPKTTVRAEILQARGTIYEILGEFDLAVFDQQVALELGRSLGDFHSVWQSLINLGMLWAARDYQKTGEYFAEALQMARDSGDEITLAYSLNRLGNFSVNNDQPDQARIYHQEALDHFSRLGDEKGIAETQDYLGMANSLGGNLVVAKENLELAIAAFNKLGDWKGMSSSLSTLSLSSTGFQTDTIVTSEITTDRGVQLAEHGLKLAADTGWKAGMCYSLINLSMCQISLGQFDRAKASIQQGFDLAGAIQHRQWQIYARLAAGLLSVELYDLDQAIECFISSLQKAVENNSVHWIHVVTASLASAYIQNGQSHQAETILENFQEESGQSISLGISLIWCTRAELALVAGQPERALEIADQIIRISHNLERGRALVRVWILRAKALHQIAENQEDGKQKESLLAQALQVIDEAYGQVVSQNYQVRLGRILREKASLLRMMGREQEALRLEDEAAQSIHRLATSIEDGEARGRFIRGAMTSS